MFSDKKLVRLFIGIAQKINGQFIKKLQETGLKGFQKMMTNWI